MIGMYERFMLKTGILGRIVPESRVRFVPICLAESVGAR